MFEQLIKHNGGILKGQAIDLVADKTNLLYNNTYGTYSDGVVPDRNYRLKLDSGYITHIEATFYYAVSLPKMSRCLFSKTVNGNNTWVLGVNDAWATDPKILIIRSETEQEYKTVSVFNERMKLTLTEPIAVNDFRLSISGIQTWQYANSYMKDLVLHYRDCS